MSLCGALLLRREGLGSPTTKDDGADSVKKKASAKKATAGTKSEEGGSASGLQATERRQGKLKKNYIMRGTSLFRTISGVERLTAPKGKRGGAYAKDREDKSEEERPTPSYESKRQEDILYSNRYRRELRTNSLRKTSPVTRMMDTDKNTH